MSLTVIFKVLAVVVLPCLISSFAFAETTPPLQTVRFVDPVRYQGQWYEIAHIPYFFQKDCAANTLIEYTILPAESDKATTFKDYFECEKTNGKKKVVVGRARVINKDTNALLTGTFLNLFGWRYWFGDNYWITDLGKDYEYVTVGQPGRKLGWIMSRTPSMSKQQLSGIAEQLKLQGYDTCKFVMSPQAQGASQKTPLCEVVK